jgi:hypothetical protein
MRFSQHLGGTFQMRLTSYPVGSQEASRLRGVGSLAGLIEVRFANNFVDIVVARCMSVVVVGVAVGHSLVLSCCLVLVEVAAALTHHIDRSFVSVAEIGMPCFFVVLEL